MAKQTAQPFYMREWLDFCRTYQRTEPYIAATKELWLKGCDATEEGNRLRRAAKTDPKAEKQMRALLAKGTTLRKRSVTMHETKGHTRPIRVEWDYTAEPAVDCLVTVYSPRALAVTYRYAFAADLS